MPRRPGTPSRHSIALAPDALRRLLRIYQDNTVSICMIAVRFGISEESVHKLAQDNGLPRRPYKVNRTHGDYYKD